MLNFQAFILDVSVVPHSLSMFSQPRLIMLGYTTKHIKVQLVISGGGARRLPPGREERWVSATTVSSTQPQNCSELFVYEAPFPEASEHERITIFITESDPRAGLQTRLGNAPL